MKNYFNIYENLFISIFYFLIYGVYKVYSGKDLFMIYNRYRDCNCLGRPKGIR